MELAPSLRPPRVVLLVLGLAALTGAVVLWSRASGDSPGAAIAPRAPVVVTPDAPPATPVAAATGRSPSSRPRPAAAQGRPGDRRLDVRVLDGAGRPRDLALVRVARSGDDPADWTPADADGRAALAPPAGRFEVEATAPGQPLRRVEVEPLEPGERRGLELVLGQPTVVLLGRALRPDGRPLAGSWLDLALRAGGAVPEPSRRRARCGPDGGFRFELERRYADRPLERPTLELLDALGHRTRLSAELPALAPGLGDNRLGAVVLSPTPIVLSGSVGKDGGTLAGIELRLERATSQGGWEAVPDLDFHPLGSGAFELRGRPEPGAFRLTVRAPAFLPLAPIPVASGQQDLRLELVRGGTLRARVQGDHDLDGLLVPAGATDSAPRRQRAWRNRDGTMVFVWSGLPAGMWTLLVLEPGGDEPLHEVSGLQVELGQVTPDPRLSGIDLRGR